MDSIKLKCPHCGTENSIPLLDMLKHAERLEASEESKCWLCKQPIEVKVTLTVEVVSGTSSDSDSDA